MRVARRGVGFVSTLLQKHELPQCNRQPTNSKHAEDNQHCTEDVENGSSNRTPKQWPDQVLKELDLDTAHAVADSQADSKTARSYHRSNYPGKTPEDRI